MQEKVLTSLTDDEGYFSVEEVCCLQGERVRVVVGDPHEPKRRKDKQSGVVKQVLSKAKRAVKSKSGKVLLRKRGEYLERSFCHVLDHRKHRRATLRGRVNLTKRQLVAALTHNLSLLMRHLTGYGTVKQCQTGNRMGGCARFAVVSPGAAGFCGRVSNSSRIGLFQQAVKWF